MDKLLAEEGAAFSLFKEIYIFGDTKTPLMKKLITFLALAFCITKVQAQCSLTISFTATQPCDGTPVVFTNTSPNQSSITAWSWDFGDGSATSASVTPSHVYASAGCYPVVLTATNNVGCTASFSATVTVHPNPVALFTAYEACLGIASKFVDGSSIVNPGCLNDVITSWYWSYGDGGPQDLYNNSNLPDTVKHTYPFCGGFNVTLTVTTDNGCKNTNTLTGDTVYCIPIVTTPPSFSICPGGNAPVQTFTSTCANGGTPTTYWFASSTHTGMPATDSANGGTNIVPSFNGSINNFTGHNLVDTINALAVSGVGCQSNAVFYTITMYPTPVMIASGATVCPADIVPVPSIVTNPVGGVTFNWSVTNNVNIGMPASGTGMPVAYTAPGNNTGVNQIGVVTYIPSLFGCVGTPATDTICVKPTPFMQPIANQTVCANSMTNPVVFDILPPPIATSVLTYNWSYNSGGIPQTGITPVFPSIGPIANPGSTPIATIVNVSPTLNGCQGPDSSFMIVVNPAAIASFTLTPDAVPHTWDAYPTYAADIASATWDWGDGTTTTALYPSHTYSAAGTYVICVAITNTTGCTASFCQSDSVFRLANNSAYSSMVYINVKQGATGIEQVTGINNQVTVYPNPATTGLQVSFAGNNVGSTLVITDMLGKTVKQVAVNNNQVSINVADLSEGVYFLNSNTANGTVIKKFVVQH